MNSETFKLIRRAGEAKSGNDTAEDYDGNFRQMLIDAREGNHRRIETDDEGRSQTVIERIPSSDLVPPAVHPEDHVGAVESFWELNEPSRDA